MLYWGILGAIVFRAIFVAIGTGLLTFGPWVESCSPPSSPGRA